MTLRYRCPWDYLEVRDGATPEAKLIGTYCGQQKPGTIRSRSNVLYLKFRSDRGLSHGGFQANYSICKSVLTKLQIPFDSSQYHNRWAVCFTASCGGTIIDQSGTIFSPGYPASYPVSGDSDCEWYIQVPGTRRKTCFFRFIRPYESNEDGLNTVLPFFVFSGSFYRL